MATTLIAGFVLEIAVSEKLPRFSDKVSLPPSVLLAAIDAFGQKLPHPLIFRLRNEENHKSTYVGVKEFTAPPETVVVPESILQKLLGAEKVTVELATELPKASFLRLKPLQFYAEVNNWKFYLESILNKYYTTLTINELLVIEPDSQTKYELLVEDANLPTVVIIDTDITLDVTPLNDIMATQQMEYNTNLNFLENIKEVPGSLFEHERLAPFVDNVVVPQIYKVDVTRFTQQYLEISIQNTSISDDKDYTLLFNVDFLAGFDRLVGLENFRYSTMDQDFTVQQKLDFGDGPRRKSVLVDLKCDEIVNMLQKGKLHLEDELAPNEQRWLYIVPFTWDAVSNVKVSINESAFVPSDSESDIDDDDDPSEVTCSNCQKRIEKTKFRLHEVFCLRKNKRCSCGLVFLEEIPSSHWHCELCDDNKLFYGSSRLLKFKHDKLVHSGPYQCSKCDDNIAFASFVDLVRQHRSLVCSQKLHECQFCHLVLPQGSATFADNFENLTNHENDCGNRTSECYKCRKILRLKDFAKHMRWHTLDKMSLNNDTKFVDSCSNENCASLLQNSVSRNVLGLCDVCYGPFYVSQLDADNSKLQLRLERRYMLQLTKGCGQKWCQNPECATGNPGRASLGVKGLLERVRGELLPHIVVPKLPIQKDSLGAGTNHMWFCVNELALAKRTLVDGLCAEGEYLPGIIWRAVDAGGTEDGARKWLEENGIRVA